MLTGEELLGSISFHLGLSAVWASVFLGQVLMCVLFMPKSIIWKALKIEIYIL